MSIGQGHGYHRDYSEGSADRWRDQPMPMPAPQHLCISDIERLAKAGVQVSVGPILPCADAMPPPQPPYTQDPMAEAIWDRWMRAKRAGSTSVDDFFVGTRRPFLILATQHGDTVWVSIHPANFSYEPFQLKDDAAIFPSDALMANIALWEREHPTP